MTTKIGCALFCWKVHFSPVLSKNLPKRQAENEALAIISCWVNSGLRIHEMTGTLSIRGPCLMRFPVHIVWHYRSSGFGEQHLSFRNFGGKFVFSSSEPILEEFQKPQPLLASEKVLQYTSNLYGFAPPPICIDVPSWLLSLEEREAQQYTSHSCCSTPPTCTAVRLPFVSHVYGSTFENGLGVGVTGKFLTILWGNSQSAFFADALTLIPGPPFGFLGVFLWWCLGVLLSLLGLLWLSGVMDIWFCFVRKSRTCRKNIGDETKTAEERVVRANVDEKGGIGVGVPPWLGKRRKEERGDWQLLFLFSVGVVIVAVVIFGCLILLSLHFCLILMSLSLLLLSLSVLLLLVCLFVYLFVFSIVFLL